MADELAGVNVDLVRYANCWEDADVLLKWLAPGGKVLSIASAGDNSFALLPGSDLVVAVDISPAQLALVRLKAAAIRRLEREDYLTFYGFRESPARVATYRSLRSELDADTRTYWDGESEILAAGLASAGKFERYFRLFRTAVLPLIHGRKRVDELFRPKDAEAQARFYDTKWNTVRWRLLFKVFFSRFVMGRLGRDPEFLRQVEVGVSDFLFHRAADHLRNPDAAANGFLQFIHRGTFGEGLPYYVRPGNYERVRENLGSLRTRLGLVQDAMAGERFDRFNLSNIFEYMPRDVFLAVGRALVDGGAPGARYSYWNLMVPRRLSDEFAALRPAPGLADGPVPEDKGFFYRRFCTEELHG